MAKELAQVAFEAYNAQGPNPGKTWDGKDVPPWEKCGEQVQAKWRAAAAAVRPTYGDPVESIARVCHEVNRAYCAALGDTSQLPWEQAPEWQRESAIKGVRYHLEHPESSPADSHNSWLEDKRLNGWKYGPVKDVEKREHPCFVPYDQLPAEQRAKDFLFLGVVRTLAHG